MSTTTGQHWGPLYPMRCAYLSRGNVANYEYSCDVCGKGRCELDTNTILEGRRVGGREGGREDGREVEGQEVVIMAQTKALLRQSKSKSQRRNHFGDRIVCNGRNLVHT